MASCKPSFWGREGPFLKRDLYLGVVADEAGAVDSVAAWRLRPWSTRSTKLLFLLRWLLVVPLLGLLDAGADSAAPLLALLPPRSCFSSSSTPPREEELVSLGI